MKFNQNKTIIFSLLFTLLFIGNGLIGIEELNKQNQISTKAIEHFDSLNQKRQFPVFCLISWRICMESDDGQLVIFGDKFPPDYHVEKN